MGVHSNLPPGAFLIEDFLAFTESRPDEEKWELIEGRPHLSPSPNRRHQTIVGNVHARLFNLREKLRAPWEIILGIGVEISPISAPVLDLIIRNRDDLAGSVCDDVIVAFEVLSPSTADHDLRWKRRAYTSLPSLMHYVIIAQDDVDVIVYDRAAGFAERRIETLGANLELASLGLSLALRDIYENTGVAER
jgi:Uma2 family endonuclease